MRYKVTHRTTYRYSSPVDIADHMVHLTPRDVAGQTVLTSHVACSPAPSRRRRHTDHFGNEVVFLAIEEPHEAFTVTATARVDVAFTLPPRVEDSPPWESVRDLFTGDSLPPDLDAAEMIHPSPMVPLSAAARAYAEPSFPPGRPWFLGLRDLTARIHLDFVFDPEATAISTPVGEVLARRRGVCQDFAHVQIACLRSLGLPARYVSGYLRTYPPPGQPRRVGADASHAWLAAWCPDAGWIQVDPTNDLIVAEEHVVLGWGRDYGDISPIRGVLLGGGQHSLEVAVELEQES